MNIFKIQRWDSIIPPGSTESMPMIYIYMTPELLVFAKNNNYMFMVTIKNSNSIYDNKKIPGTLDQLFLGTNVFLKEFQNVVIYNIILHSFFY